MSKLLSDNEATGQTKELFDEIKKKMGMVPNFFRAQAANDPEWAKINFNRWKYVMGETHKLDRKTKELIALAVSLVNRCEYCCNAHTMAAKMTGSSEEEINEVKEVVELFESFNSIADSLNVPGDNL
jgi:AhpD family alkylhydroperoxidase